MFLQKCIEFLGWSLSPEGRRPLPKKVEAIMSMSRPRTKRELKSFLGSVSFYHPAVDKFSQIAAPLTDLLKNSSPFKWTDIHEASYASLKSALCESSILAFPRLDLVTEENPLHLHCDASDVGVSGHLSMMIDGQRKVIEYFSKKLSPTQQRYSTIEKEAFAIVAAVKYFAPLIQLVPLKIISDHKPILSLLSKTPSNSRLFRWSNFLSSFAWGSPNLIEYVKGEQNAADYASRRPYHEATDFDPEPSVTTSYFMRHDSSQAPPPPIRLSVAAIDEDRRPENADTSGDEPPQPFQGNPIITEDLPPFPIDLATVADLQRKDDDFKDIILHLENPSHPAPAVGKVVRAAFCLGDHGELYYLPEQTRPLFIPRCLAVPTPLRPAIISLSHDALAHAGFEKTLSRLQSSYYFPGMYTQVKDYIEACIVCVLRSKSCAKAPLQHLPIPHSVMSTLSFDVLHLPPDHEGRYSKVLGVVDLLSSYLCLYPLKDESSASIANVFLSQHIPRHGFFHHLFSDSAKANCAKVLNLIFERLGVRRSTTTPHWSPANGKIERCFRFVQDHLARVTHQDRQSWPIFLDTIAFLHNTSRSSTLKETPFFIVHQRDPLGPADVLIGHSTDSVPADSLTGLSKAQQRLFRTIDLIRQRLKESQSENEERYNERCHTTNQVYAPGDPVCVQVESFPTHNDRKLSLRFEPDWVVEEVTSPVTYIIRHRLTGKRKSTHASKIKIQPRESILDVTSVLPAEPSPSKAASGALSRKRSGTAAELPKPPAKAARSAFNLLPLPLPSDSTLTEEARDAAVNPSSTSSPPAPEDLHNAEDTAPPSLRRSTRKRITPRRLHVIAALLSRFH